MTGHAKTHYETWAGTMGAMKAQAPAIAQGFGAMFQRLMGEGALSVREKELIAAAIGLATRCEPCVYAHVEKAVKAGATREQLLEMAGVVVVMQGGPGYVHVPELIDAMETLGI
ncbi:MAG: carboxymuconolactone decarboxylase family protein [Phycisphaerales bacterium]|jgi:AhpD family alkylhydroperoxidase|nr:carboxymuconolactone decarboxylase family protein [Phycisphaerales bacterium]